MVENLLSVNNSSKEVPDSEEPPTFTSVAIKPVASSEGASSALWEMLKVIFITKPAMFLGQQVLPLEAAAFGAITLLAKKPVASV
jgi:hypothetical protein